MKKIYFTYHGTRYGGSVVVSREEYPHYFWCYLDDPGLIKKVGECISYQMQEGASLQLTDIYAGDCRELLKVIRNQVIQLMVADPCSLTCV